jgi:flagellar motor protein MotB
MKFSWMSSVVLGLFFFTSIGCQSTGLKDENASLKRDNQTLKTRLDESESARRNAPDPTQVQALQNELAARESRIKELEGQLRRPEAGSDPDIAGIATSYDRKKGELTVSLPSDVLFAPGSSELKAGSRTTLEKLVAAIKHDYAGKKIRVEGHTDKDPVARSQDKWIDNLDLSQNRAGAVARYLMERGVDKKNIATVGYGDTHPKGTKAASRRVEIVVVVG